MASTSNFPLSPLTNPRNWLIVNRLRGFFYFSVTQNQTQISSKTRRILKIAIPKLSKEMLKYVSVQQRPFLQCTSYGVRDLQGRPQQDSRLTLCSHAQARSSSPCSSCAPSCTCSASPKGSCES